jgi:hypothetical protein
MKNAFYGKLLVGIVVAWFVFALIASAFNVFQASAAQPPIPLGLGAGIPVIAFLLWFAASESLRSFVMSLSPRGITLIHSWRVAGLAFVALYAYHLLPGFFALPAGYGDIALGLTAPVVALKWADPEHRAGFILWQILGITDLVTAVGLGAGAAYLQPHGIPTSPMTVLPLSIIPTFGVPLLMILHFISIAQALRWREVRYAGIAQQMTGVENSLHAA